MAKRERQRDYWEKTDKEQKRNRKRECETDEEKETERKKEIKQRREDDCHTHGGYLVVIPDAGTQTFIMTTLRLMGYQGKRLWIGLSDKEKEHSWKWVTGSRLSHYSHWGPGESNDNILHWSQDCVFLYYTKNGYWHDNACHLWPEHFNYICQYDMLPTKRPTVATTTATTTKKPSTTPTHTTLTTTSLTTETTTSVTTTTTTTTGTCQDTNCQKECPNGYSGIFVGSDGCVHCRCN